MTQTTDEMIKRIVREFLDPDEGTTPLFAACSVLGIHARVIARELEITTSQMSHYRTGATPVPSHRMVKIKSLLREFILKMEKEIAAERKKKLSPIRSVLIEGLEKRIQMATKILEHSSS